MTDKIVSGYFRAHVIPVPAQFIDKDGFVPIRMTDPYRSYCQIDPPGQILSPYVIDFWGSDQGALLLRSASPTEAEVRILLALGVEPGEYAFDAHFFHYDTGAPLFRSEGSFVVEQGEKEDCGCHTLRTLPPPTTAHVPVDEGVVVARLAVCSNCDQNEDGVCLACGCQLNHKAAQAHESCPLGKWPDLADLGVPEVPKKRKKAS